MAGATLGASAVFAASAQAASYTVTGTGDPTTPGTCTAGQCTTLRAAIAAANADNTADTIGFDPSLAHNTITLTTANGSLQITDTGGVTIDGSAAPGLSISGANSVQVFTVNAGPTAINNLTVMNGQSGSVGGAIQNRSGTLTLNNDTITGSAASGDGGAVETYEGTLNISGSTITGNTSGGDGGGVAGFGKYFPPTVIPAHVTITDSTIGNNAAQEGGGVGGSARFSIVGSKITGNTLSGNTGTYGNGGGIAAYGGSLSVSGTTVSGNMDNNTGTSAGGGGIAARTKYGTSITGSTVSGNTGAVLGGGVEIQSDNAPNNPNNPVLIQDTTIANNRALTGSGVDVSSKAPGTPITISRTTISGNSPQQSAGTNEGGGLAIGDNLANSFDLVDSTISGNSSTLGGGVAIGDNQGPLLSSASGASGSVSFDNSTIASNSASGKGGGIYLSAYTSGTTVKSGTADLSSSIVGHDTAANAPNDLAQGSGATAGGFNVSYSLITQPGNAKLLTSQSVIKGADPQLGPLASNGGPTQTMLPAFTSPVIDQGKNSLGLATDQRGTGFPRTVNNGKTRPAGGDGTDIGAVEVGKIPVGAVIRPATKVTSSKATLNGKVTTNGLAVTWYFQWGRTTSYGHQTPTQSIGQGQSGPASVSFRISGLSKGRVYHYRLVVSGSSGATATSADSRFRTAAPSIKISPRVVLEGTAVRLSGTTGGCPAGDRVTLLSFAFSNHHTFAGKPVVYATAMRDGRYSTTTTIPKTRAPGSYSVTGRCGGANFGVSADLRVIAPPKPKFTG